MKHLRNRVFFQILIPTLCVYIALSCGGYVAYRNSYEDSMIEKKNLQMLNLSRVLSDWVSGRIRELMILAGSEAFDGTSRDRHREYLLQRRSGQSFDFDHFWFFSEDGDYWNTGNQTGTVSGYADFHRYFNGELLFMYFVPDERHDPRLEGVVIFAVPVHEQGAVIGLLGGSIKHSELRRLLRYYAYDMFDEIALVDLSHPPGENGGRIIAHSERGLTGKSEVPVWGEIYTTNQHRKNGSIFVTTLINNWKLVGHIENDALFFQHRSFLRFFVLIMLVIIAVISAISIGISQLISNPIVSLTDMVNKMLQGDFNNEISVRTSDELQSLANAFNLLNKRNIQLRTDDRFSFLGRISSRMAHEIRHPLQVIQIAIQSMNAENFGRIEEVIRHEIKNSDRFVREILEIAKPNELSLELFSMNRLLENVHRKFQLLGDEKGVRVHFIPESENTSFFFDVLKVEQVMTNILTNSLEVTGAGGEITIRVSNSRDGELIVTITDTGPGFDKATIDRIFDPYFSTKGNGTGLGLSICYQILTAHGAHIELGDNEPAGALTRLIFPSLSG